MAQRRRRRKQKNKIWIFILMLVIAVVFLTVSFFSVWKSVNKNEVPEIAGKSSVQNQEAKAEQDDIPKEIEDAEETEEVEAAEKKQLVVIDAGHQQRGNSEKEPIGPGASEKKAKVASGATGVATKRPEYEVTLEVSEKLQAVLEERGYEVLMVRTENNVNISNAERAEVANRANADAFVRIHCNGAENQSVNGAMTICMTLNNPYCPEIYSDSKSLAEKVLNNLCRVTGARRQRVWETDSMSGINWCKVPVTIVEMGYMSNPEEDRKLSDSAYQEKLVTGIADGIEEYFREKE